jgi:cytochrome bd-type quinol oxidase subunit 2
VLAPLIGIALAAAARTAHQPSQNYTGSFWDLLQPYALFTGTAGRLRSARRHLPVLTNGELHQRARRLARHTAQ